MATAAFTIDKAELVSLLIEAILYGLYTFFFSITIYVLIYKRSSPQIHYGMFIATIALFTLATAHLITNFLRLLDAFSLSQTQPGAASTVLVNQATFKNLFKSSALLAEIVIGDIVLIYRCYVAWGRSIRIIIMPLVILLGTGASSIGIIYSFSKLTPQADLFAVHRLRAFITSTQVLVLVNNLLCTSLLAWKLWYMSRAMVSREQRHTLRSVAIIIAESGLMTAITWVIFIIVFATRSPAQIIFLDSLAPITGSAFCLIVTRVALGVDGGINTPQSDAVHHRGDEPTASVLPVLDGTGRPHRPMEISVSSRHSVRVETEMNTLYQDKKAIVGLGFL